MRTNEELIYMLESLFAERVSELHLTQREVAERIGVSQPLVSRIVTHKSLGDVSWTMLIRFLERLGVDVDIDVRVKNPL